MGGMPKTADTTETETCRLDVWLWRARFFKTRGLSASFSESGAVRVMRFGNLTRTQKAGFALRIGDRLIFAIGQRLFDVTVTAMGERRGPASEAQALYTISDQAQT